VYTSVLTGLKQAIDDIRKAAVITRYLCSSQVPVSKTTKSQGVVLQDPEVAVEATTGSVGPSQLHRMQTKHGDSSPYKDQP